MDSSPTAAKSVIRDGTSVADHRRTGELAADGEQVDQPDDHFDSHLSRLETLDLLEASKQNYQGVARLGIEALALKVQGMRITDIAALYQVPPSHVGAWISRSLEKLRNDPDFLTCLL